MAKLSVDGIEVEVPNGASVIQACEAAGIEIPRFCYHERLSVAGNCRMCLVEVEKAPKPVASCAYPVAEGMKVFTDTPMVRNARRGVMEFLLINHPLDCPICDQGGECDLQDQAVGYGMDRSRYAEEKRVVKDKYVGPLIKTIMTRCIQCTRCVRFAAEVAGTPELGATNRGENLEIGTYVEKALTSELSGNLIDICPVGALTSRPYAYAARPWELRKTDSIDVQDATGTATRVDTRGPEVMRILPRVNEAVNEEWMADRGRFSFDGLKRKRLDRPWVRRRGKLAPATWPEAFAAIAAKLDATAPERIGAVSGDLVDAESTLALRDLMRSYGAVNLDCRQDGAAIDATRGDYFRFNSGIAGIDEADAILLIGTDLRREAPVINARVRKRWTHGGVAIAYVGPTTDLTYPAQHLGDGPSAMQGFTEALDAAKRPMIILGRGALARADGAAVLAAAWKLAQDSGALTPEWHGFNLLHLFGGQVGALELGFVQGKTLGAMMGGEVDALWLLGADGFDPARIGAETFVIYQGHHGDRAAARADVILPGAAYTEKDATYVNTEGRAQRAFRAIHPPGEAREDWRILRAYSEGVGKTLPYDTIDAVRAALAAAAPCFGAIDMLAAPGCTDTAGPMAEVPLGEAAFIYPLTSYHLADQIARASDVMAECASIYGGAAPRLAAE
ncbi:MAG: NADH-quinone oxidoreductase subunit [Rhodospirillales bacterium]|jgi:NADH-quinone oxidoreductase subunit G|nr:NADH-quinone oxidoreductase subunit [Rhodospirillales bacterium]